MISLRKLDNSPVIVNLDSVKYIEAIPDTLIHFLNGDSVIVRENFAEVIQMATEFKAAILMGLREQAPPSSMGAR